MSDENNNHGKECESLCATCFCFDCSWHEWFEPVEGWTAIPTVIQENEHPIPSYRVIACPFYDKGVYKEPQHAITLREICKHTGMTMRTLQRRLKNKKDVFVNGRKVCQEQKSGSTYNYYFLEETL